MVITNFSDIYNKQNLYILCLVPELAEYFWYCLLICILEF